MRTTPNPFVLMAKSYQEYVDALNAPPPEGWVCPHCGEGDTEGHPGQRVDLSTASGKSNRQLVFVHLDCWEKAWDEAWGRSRSLRG